MQLIKTTNHASTNGSGSNIRVEELANYRRSLIKGYQEIGAEIENIAERSSADKADLFQEGTGWNTCKIFLHIREVEMGYFLPYIKRILVGEKVELGVYEAVEKRGKYEKEGEQLQEIISDLIVSCRFLTTMLGEMSEKDWNRTGRHLQSGNHTVQWYLEQNLAHLKAHIRQLAGYLDPAAV